MNISKYVMPLSVIPEIELQSKGGFVDRLPWFQNNLGSCGAMSTARALSNVFGFPVSTLWIYINAKLQEDSFDTEGLTFESLVYVACSIGVIPESMLPYSDEIEWSNKTVLQRMIRPEMYQEAAKHKVKGVVKLTESNHIKRALTAKYPVIWGAAISSDFRYDEDGYVLLSGVFVGGHAMHMPNYDDNMSYRFKEYNHTDKGFVNIDQTWKINDELWGDDGKGHISYRALDDEIVVVEGQKGFRLWNECYCFVPFNEDHQRMLKPIKQVELHIDDLAYEINDTVKVMDVPPYIKNGRTMIPLRALSEGLGYKVDWLEATKEIVISNQWGSIKLKVGSKKIYMKSVVQELEWIKSEKQMDVPVEIVQGRSFVPVRFVAEKMGCVIGWNGETRSVLVHQY